MKNGKWTSIREQQGLLLAYGKDATISGFCAVMFKELRGGVTQLQCCMDLTGKKQLIGCIPPSPACNSLLGLVVLPQNASENQL